MEHDRQHFPTHDITHEVLTALSHLAQANPPHACFSAIPARAVLLTPKRVIFHPPATVVEWADGTKTIVKCHDDNFSEEFGYAMACMRKIYGSRNNFFAQFRDAQRPTDKIRKQKPQDWSTSPF